ncbi:peroxisomal targeting signal 2 receptor [Xanthoria parietina]
MLEFRTQGFNGYAVKYSPFVDSRIAVASGANFGLVGNGRLYILGLTAKGIVAEKWFDTQDSLYDLAWAESHENQCVVATGDGSIKLFDITLDQFPVQSWQEHKREVYAVHWNLVAKDTFCSSSWDGTIKIWSPHRADSLVTLPTHSCTYSASFSPHSPSVLSSVSSDSHLRLFDLRAPASAANHLTASIPLHTAANNNNHNNNGQHHHHHHHHGAMPPSEALTHDWNKYRPQLIAAAGVDRLVRVFDIRNPSQGPVAVLPGHGYAVRKVAWSPHLGDVLLSASYDMTCRVWTDGSALGVDGEQQQQQQGLPEVPNGRAGADSLAVGGGRELGRMDRHTEFVMGVDWCLFGAEGWCASVGWDERLLVWDVRQVMDR